MPPTDTLDKAQAEADQKPDALLTAPLESPAGDQPSGVEQPKVDGEQPPTDSPVSVAELKALLEARDKQYAKLEADFELTRKKLSAIDRAEAAAKKGRETDVQVARLAAETRGTDPDAAERVVRQAHDTDDREQLKTQTAVARAEREKAMGDALVAADITLEEWNDSENDAVRPFRLQWDFAVNQGYTEDARALEKRVKAMKKPTPPVETPPQKTRAEKEAALSLADPGNARGGARGMTLAAALRAKNVSEISDGDYERIVAAG